MGCEPPLTCSGLANKPWPRPSLGSLTRPSLGSVSIMTSTPPNCRIIQPTCAVGCYHRDGNSTILKVATVRRKSSEGADRGAGDHSAVRPIILIRGKHPLIFGSISSSRYYRGFAVRNRRGPFLSPAILDPFASSGIHYLCSLVEAARLGIPALRDVYAH